MITAAIKSLRDMPRDDKDGICLCRWDTAWEPRRNGQAQVQTGFHLTRVHAHCRVHGDPRAWTGALKRLEEAGCCGQPLKYASRTWTCPACDREVNADWILYGPEIPLFDAQEAAS